MTLKPLTTYKRFPVFCSTSLYHLKCVFAPRLTLVQNSGHIHITTWFECAVWFLFQPTIHTYTWIDFVPFWIYMCSTNQPHAILGESLEDSYVPVRPASSFVLIWFSYYIKKIRNWRFTIPGHKIIWVARWSGADQSGLIFAAKISHTWRLNLLPKYTCMDWLVGRTKYVHYFSQEMDQLVEHKEVCIYFICVAPAHGVENKTEQRKQKRRAVSCGVFASGLKKESAEMCCFSYKGSVWYVHVTQQTLLHSPFM